ncbi:MULTISPECIES: hypothetical protein [unclassified Streptomyces]|uniref:SPOR domain-containing protein n=1 Tax=Streptomyces evansiae TaxID=3075535 RepID=A0ABU2R1U2_9ACTN|nr:MULTISPECIES: hypothetical protein [unclassified Streptomyces]MDT0410317.1 hypothetical protein [Streptomyces sp. DSM 41979]MDT0425039.1 hypothetical protein [Streptomyces sp. DSM 41859]WEH29606.1 hypothetical protein P0D76_21065 [Streptomyces sp. AM 3-1-1]SCD78465.1 hypothetical protein GA0115251_12378 [Streptomyces sp. TverLS-915]SCE56771.1 hypothetical protein GA0115252_166543 [Streptomyces sp. DfronAA-171]
MRNGVSTGGVARVGRQVRRAGTADPVASLPWQLIRRDNGEEDSYRVASYATRAEAERRADGLNARVPAPRALYVVEHADDRPRPEGVIGALDEDPLR